MKREKRCKAGTKKFSAEARADVEKVAKRKNVRWSAFSGGTWRGMPGEIAIRGNGELVQRVVRQALKPQRTQKRKGEEKSFEVFFSQSLFNNSALDQTFDGIIGRYFIKLILEILGSRK